MIRRRLIGVFMILGFGALATEPLIADACDGDAPASVAIAAQHEGPPPPGSGAPSGHTVHVCHCAHAHGYVLVTNEGTTAAAVLKAAVVFTASLPTDPSLDLQLRPPIA